MRILGNFQESICSAFHFWHSYRSADSDWNKSEVKLTRVVLWKNFKIFRTYIFKKISDGCVCHCNMLSNISEKCFRYFLDSFTPTSITRPWDKKPNLNLFNTLVSSLRLECARFRLISTLDSPLVDVNSNIKKIRIMLIGGSPKH